MSELSQYVDKLFAGYTKNRQNEELKAEIQSNLEAKKADLLAAGLSETEAIERVKASITNIDGLIDGNIQVYIHQLKFEMIQWVFIILLVEWILTIPCLIFHLGVAANSIFFLAVLLVGLYYLYLCRKQSRSETYRNKTAFIDSNRCKKIKKSAWILWGIFAFVFLLANSAIHFGSNFWFAKKIIIDGPYAMASLLISYFFPMCTIVIPIFFSLPLRLISKYEVGCDNEK